MKSVFFGVAHSAYDHGTRPRCAINDSNVIVEVHASQGLPPALECWLGTVNGTEIQWASHVTIPDEPGRDPSVALNNSGLVFEAHDSGHGALWYWLGRLSNGSLIWSGHGHYDDGVTPSVALNNSGQIVEVHESGQGRLWYRVGHVSGGDLSWTDHAQYDGGITPSVALNDSGMVVEVHDSGHGTLWYRIGQIANGKLTWTAHGQYDDGVSPSVAITPDGCVVEVHQSGAVASLWQRIAAVTPASLTWVDWFGQGRYSYSFDDGVTPSVAFGRGCAIQVHQSGLDSGLFATASLWFDRANWMGANLAAMNGKPLGAVYLPASHDSGMYLDGLSALGKTQDLNIYGQLNAGVRYFDLRPANQSGRLILYHGDWDGVRADGPAFNDVMADVQRFMTESHRELVILKFSHYGGFDQPTFEAMCQTIYQYLGRWLHGGPPPTGAAPPANSWLATMTIGDYLVTEGTCLVVCDGAYTAPAPPPGVDGAIRVYRDWNAADPHNGDLTVFDVYSNTISLNDMIDGTESDPNVHTLPQGQLPKFRAFDGRCQSAGAQGSVRCGLFLLSWTLTPPTDVWAVSRTANAALGPRLASLGPNGGGFVANLLYVDYVEHARIGDVAVVLNGIAPASG